MEKQTGAARLQFTLRDALLISVLIASGMFLLVAQHLGRMGAEALAPWLIGMLPIGLAGGYVGICMANRTKFGTWGRSICIAAVMAVLSWGYVMVIACVRMQSSPDRHNVTAAAAACKAFAEAEEIYRRTDYNGDGVLEFAQRVRGSDSLLERTAGAEDLALVDKSFAYAEGPAGIAKPKNGYVFKVLTAQGSHAKGGKKSYVDAKGRMTEGFALVASPAVYGGVGHDTFIINNDGLIYQKDLGPNTAQIVNAMTEFDPDTIVWRPTE